MNTTTTIYYFSNFLEYYHSSISPKLREIDIFIKTSEGIMDNSDVACLLYISKKELKEIMFINNIKFIDVNNFFRIMESGSSYICKLYYRERKCGSPYVYTREQISYIYELDINTINIICDNLHIKKITNYSLPLIFKEISVPAI